MPNEKRMALRRKKEGERKLFISNFRFDFEAFPRHGGPVGESERDKQRMSESKRERARV